MVPYKSESPPKGLRRKNPIIYIPHKPQSTDYDDAKQSLVKASSKEAQDSKEVDTSPKDRQSPLLALTTTSMPIIG